MLPYHKLIFEYKQISQNYASRNNVKITRIVIHDTANFGIGAGALAHFKYFNGGYRGSSAHYFVDDKRIVQIVGDSMASWAVGKVIVAH